MKHWLDRLEQNMPHWMITIQLQILMHLTASAFQQKSRWILFAAPDEALRQYACYTRAQLLQVQETDMAALQKRMYEKSRRMGALLRRVTRLFDENHLARLVFLLYNNIGITMQGSLPGVVTISKCYFSAYYTPQMCQMISSMDAGIVSGIFGGGELRFTQRITEGCGVCTACFTQSEDVNL